MFSAEDEERLAASVLHMHEDVGPIPETVAVALPCFAWDMERMRAYPAPVTSVPLHEVSHFLQAPIWRRAGSIPFTLAPVEVARRPQAHAGHYAQAMAADLQFPIDIICRREGWRLADGYHRLLKASILGNETIDVRLIPEHAIPLILADLEGFPPPRGGRAKA